jgi:hypothetical protein
MLRIELHTPESLCRQDESTTDHKGVVQCLQVDVTNIYRIDCIRLCQGLLKEAENVRLMLSTEFNIKRWR